MREFEAKFSIGSLLISLGAAYILRNMYLTNDFFFTFLGIFFLLEGLYNVIAQTAHHEKRETTQSLLLLFIGISILLFELSVLAYSAILLISLIVGSIGLALMLSGAFFSLSERNIFIGVILIVIGLIFAMPVLFNVSDKLNVILKDYGIGILLIVLGIIVFLPRRKGE
jgi:uncharacterized membrane protein HdeD (DUF308 family)